MGNHDRAADANLHERLMHQERLAGGRSVRHAARPFAPAVTGTVDQDHPVCCRQPFAKRKPHVAQIGTGAVQQDHRRCIGVTELQQMHPAAIDLDEPAGGWVLPFDPADADLGEHGQPGHRCHGDHDTSDGDAYRTKPHGNPKVHGMGV